MIYNGQGLGKTYSAARTAWGRFSNTAIPPNVSGNMVTGCNAGMGELKHPFLLWGTLGAVAYLLLFNKPGGIFRKK
jgi:hypothetical protein